MIILLDGKEYAVGLNWFAISSQEEVAQFQREMDMQNGVLKLTKKSGEQSTVALSGPEYVDQVSLAGILSYAYKNLIFVTRTEVKNEAGQPLYYLCAVKNGVVSVEGDVIGDLENIQSLYQQNLAEMTGDLPLESIERFGCHVDEAAFPDLNPVKIGAVLDPAQRYASACLIKPLLKKSLPVAGVVMIVGAFVVGGYFTFTWIFQAPPPPPPPPVQTQEIVIKKDPFQSFLEGFLPTLQSMPRPDVIADFVDTIKTIPMSLEGWQLVKISYSGAQKDFIGLELKRNSYTTVNNLSELTTQLPLKSVNLKDDLNSATATYPFSSSTGFISQSAIQALNKETEGQYYDFASLMQAHHILFQNTIDLSLEYFIGNHFTIQGENLWALNRVGALLQTIPTLGIQSISVQYQSGKYTWTLEGMVYG